MECIDGEALLLLTEAHLDKYFEAESALGLRLKLLRCLSRTLVHPIPAVLFPLEVVHPLPRTFSPVDCTFGERMEPRHQKKR